MEYQWTKQDGAYQESDVPARQNCRINIMTEEEFQEKFPVLFRRGFIGGKVSHNRFCKADRLNKTVAGTFSIPLKESPSKEKTTFGFCMRKEELIFIDDADKVRQILDEMQGYPLTDSSSPALLLFDFMEYLLKDDMIFLQEYEERLTRLEEELLNGKAEGFDRKILSFRKELSALSAYYEQLSDMGETLQQNAAEQGDEKDSLLFGLYSDKAGRLYSAVQMLKEYSMQLREMHQTQIDVRQNQIMKFLTIVTTIFMPLTLIAGWYGMNFVNMPELSSPYGYIIICVICLLVIVVEILIFKIKGWFN